MRLSSGLRSWALDVWLIVAVFPAERIKRPREN
jgi:hypothetical protein